MTQKIGGRNIVDIVLPLKSLSMADLQPPHRMRKNESTMSNKCQYNCYQANRNGRRKNADRQVSREVNTGMTSLRSTTFKAETRSPGLNRGENGSSSQNAEEWEGLRHKQYYPRVWHPLQGRDLHPADWSTCTGVQHCQVSLSGVMLQHPLQAPPHQPQQHNA